MQIFLSILRMVSCVGVEIGAKAQL